MGNVPSTGSTAINDSDPSHGLSIQEFSERTGLSQATLRSWEARHGFPRPRRLAGGHRRYDEADVALVEEVVRRRASGLSLTASIERSRAHDEGSERSVFAGLRRRRPDLEPQVLRKRTLLALTRAIEDECCARSTRPILFVGFQRQEFYRQSRVRWAELARTAESVVVFSDFPAGPIEGDRPLHVPVPADAPMRREWVLICDAPDHPACLTGWEQPDRANGPDSDRRFETLWTVDPPAVRDAARIAAQLTETFAPGHGRPLVQALALNPPPASADLRRAASLLNRMVGYLERRNR